MTRFASQEVTQQELAEIIGITDRQLRNLKTTVPAKGKRGTTLVYDLVPSVQAFIAYVQNTVETRITDKDIQAYKGRGEIARAKRDEHLERIAKVEADKAEGTVAEIALVAKFVGENNERIRAKFLALPSSVSPSVTGLKSVAKVEAILTRAVDEALSNLAEWEGGIDPCPTLEG